MARNCQTKNLQYLKPRGHFRIPQDQDGVGWCYAYSLADLLSAKVERAVSPSHLSLISTNFALKTHDRRGKVISDDNRLRLIEHLPGSSIQLAWEALNNNNNKVCLESEMSGNARLMALSDPVFGESWINIALREISIRRGSLRDGSAENSIDESSTNEPFLHKLLMLFGNAKEIPLADREHALCHLYNNLNMRDIDEVIFKTHKQSILTTLKDLSDKACQTPLSLSSELKLKEYPPRSHSSPPSRVGIIRAIDVQLAKNNLASIAYSVGSLLKDPSVNNNEDGHQSTIVGREMRDGACGYLIRNSWGMVSCPSNPRTKGPRV